VSRWALRGAAAAALLAWASAAHACPVPPSAPAGEVERALRSGPDLWGDRLLRAPGGPTLAAARRFLPPLRYAVARGGAKLTASGVYYLPFAGQAPPQGVSAPALHVADGSRIYAGSVLGRSLAVFVEGRPFASCSARLSAGWLPILRTRDGAFAQESFTALLPGVQQPVTFLRVDGRGPIRFTLGKHVLSFARGPAYVEWPRGSRARVGSATRYAAARAGLVAYWQEKLATGARIEVPEPYVADALRALLVQNLQLTWRYSVGNAYGEFSFPESVDGAEVMAEYGYPTVARSMLRTSFTRAPRPYPQWKMGERLLASAWYARLYPDDPFLAQAMPVLGRYVAALERALGPNGLLARERYSSDIPDSVYGLHGQAVVWQGLRELAVEWKRHGRAALASRASLLAEKLGAGVRRALRRSERRLPDGSLFLPMRLLDEERPYASLVEARSGSYWNLVAPYALASGLLDRAQAEGALRYLLRHGSRLLGLVRAGGYALYGRTAPFPTSGTDEVYGLNAARFLASVDEPDQLVLSLYGHLAAGMTQDTFVSGEAASVAPLGGRRERSMYLPPNSVSNAALLETLRLMLVQDRDGGLRLAYATPRDWLRPGKRIAVMGLPTSFGPLSYSLSAARGSVHVTIDVPSRRPPRTLLLRLRLPGSTRTVDLSGRTGRLDFVVKIP
jgi:hypothetical protein